MNIILPTISPQVMKKYPLYILIVFLSVLSGYFLNSNTQSKDQTIQILIIENKALKEQNTFLIKTNLDSYNAILIKNGIITDYKNVIKKTDSLSKKTLKKPAVEILKLRK